ncbi:MAG: non-lysosomal glucosylceramidase [candidate division KSB1 bacterium]|nr:non-lysosomal glucosylceramidase [candidate division KSB1 bacterium]
MCRLLLCCSVLLGVTACLSKPKNLPYKYDELLCGPAIRTFTGQALAQVAFPLGGIGTGTVSLGGRGELRDWEIFNRPGKGFSLPFTFFALWAKPVEGEPVAKILERRLLPPYTGAFGLPQNQLAGVARLDEAVFRGEYPFAWIEFHDEQIPVQVRMEAWNPLIPHDPEESGLPVALISWTVKNPTASRIKVSVASSMFNPVGTDGRELSGNALGGNLNEYRDTGKLRGLFFSKPSLPADDLRFGTMALVTPWQALDVQTRWYRGGWWDGAHLFWDDFADDGRVQNIIESDPSPQGRSDVGSLVLFAELEPGQSVTFPFLVAWYFANRVNYWNPEPAVREKSLRNHYARRFANAWEVAEYVHEHRPALEQGTRLFHQALFGSSLPGYVIDAVSSQASIIRTNTCMWLDDGSFFAFEGCGDASGCCPMNCTHVWNYEQALAYLFPSLERSMRRTDFLHNTLPNGYMTFRTLIPLGPHWWQFKACADGQMGTIIKAYREWKLSGDQAFLRELWPKVKAALEFAWKGCGSPPPPGLEWTAEQVSRPWDADTDGVMEGEQHNTYDIEFYGPNTMTGSLYLGALKAAAEMAEAMGEHRNAAYYRQLFEQGMDKYDRSLWNGQYYRQQVEVAEGIEVPEHLRMPAAGDREQGPPLPKYQYGDGCLSDQLLGQYLAHVVGLGYVLPAEHVKAAIKAVFDNNWRRAIGDFSNVQRVYAVNDEAGLLLCSWPLGNRPSLPFVYSDEVWTGIEYQVAATLIYNGWLDEGLAVVKGVRDRYDGVRRNPWDEIECGHHYARAMASWAVLLALSGFTCDMVDGKLGFAPVINSEDFACFWSTGTAWGQFRQAQGKARLEVLHGVLSLRQLSVAPAALFGSKVRLYLDGKPISARMQKRAGRLELTFAPLSLSAGQVLEVR